MSEKYEMAIFDIDGTLCDTVDITYESINEILKKHNINKKVDLQSVKQAQGMIKEEFAEYCMPFLSKNLREDLLTEADKLKYLKIHKGSIEIYDRVKEIIIELSRDYYISIVSNCDSGYIESIINKIGISEYVKDYIAASALNISKADAIEKIIKRNNIKKAIYVGDTLLDKNSSEKARVDFIFAEYGFGKISNTEYKIKRFSELPSKIKQIESDKTNCKENI